MKLFSLDWFKSEAKKEMEKLRIEEQSLKNELMRKQIKEEIKELLIHPYRKVMFVNDVLTVILKDGTILEKMDATTEDFNAVVSAYSVDAIINIISNEESKQEKIKKEEEVNRAKTIKNGFGLLSIIDDFIVEDDNTVYLKGINRSLPPLLVEKFIEIVNKYSNVKNIKYWGKDLLKDEEYISLKRFFMWCCLNPRAEVAHELYRFLTENSFRITKQGFFVALRNVVSLKNNEEKEIVNFISNAYNKIKGVWKKNPCNYNVYEEHGEYSLHKEGVKPTGNFVGNLSTLYMDLPNMVENRYTDNWTRTFDIRIGKVVKMPMEECNWSVQDCAAAGLHFTADNIYYVGCGDTSVLVLINPMRVVGIGAHKGRCYEYLPIMTVAADEATEILHDVDFDTLQLDEDYAIHELENLENEAKNGFAAEAMKYQFNIPQISNVEMGNIIKSLNEMKSEISKRVTNIF